MTQSSSIEAWQQGGAMVAIAPGDLHIFYKDFGDSAATPQQTLLLLHGFPESSHSFHKIIPGMLENFARVVVFDMPGYGYSDKPASGYSYSLVQQADAALQLWHRLGITGGHLLSHDMGTSVLTEIVARHASGLLPGWFSTGLLSATFTNGSMVLELARLRIMQRVLLSRLGAQMSRFSTYAIFAQQVRSGHGVAPGADGALEEVDIERLWQANVLQSGHRKNHLLITYLNDRKRYEKTRWLPALAAIAGTLPIHICWGDADQVAQIGIAQRLKKEVCPAATLSVMPGVGHFCQLGSPEVWVEHIAGFYRGLT